jgi:hypothetical protein
VAAPPRAALAVVVLMARTRAIETMKALGDAMLEFHAYQMPLV